MLILVISVTADVLAPNGARPSAATMISYKIGQGFVNVSFVVDDDEI